MAWELINFEELLLVNGKKIDFILLLLLLSFLIDFVELLNFLLLFLSKLSLLSLFLLIRIILLFLILPILLIFSSSSSLLVFANKTLLLNKELENDWFLEDLLNESIFLTEINPFKFELSSLDIYKSKGNFEYLRVLGFLTNEKLGDFIILLLILSYFFVFSIISK